MKNLKNKKTLYISLGSLGALIVLVLIIVLSVKSCNKSNNNNDDDNNTITTTHTHTYATTWSSDATNHWYADTCGHSTKKGEAAHTWNDGEETDSGTKYTCTVCGYEKTEASRYQVTEAKWNEIFTNVSNCTYDVVTSTFEQITYFDENVVMIEVVNGSKTLYAVEDGKYYQYILALNATEWTRTEISEEQYKSFATLTLFNIFIDKYSEFAYSAKSKSYTLASLNIDGSTKYQNIQISFEDNKVTRVKYILIPGTSGTYQVEFNNFGSTEVTVPTNIHTHTYSSAWTYDETSHWHKATCGHNFNYDEELHTIVDGKCTVCGYLVPTDGIIYSKVTEDTCEVYGFPSGTSASGKVVIASTYNGLAVTSIRYRAFAFQEEITSVVIPSSVKKICTQAFMGCAKLEKIELSEGLEYIGENAFMNCPKVTSIVIPKSVKTICDNIFASSANLTKVYYAGTAEEFGQIELYTSNYQFLTVATRYYYSESQPTDTTNKYWHYVNGVVTEW